MSEIVPFDKSFEERTKDRCKNILIRDLERETFGNQLFHAGHAAAEAAEKFHEAIKPSLPIEEAEDCATTDVDGSPMKFEYGAATYIKADFKETE